MMRIGFLMFLVVAPLMVQANEFDPNPAWPLCGRIAENPPNDWQPGDACPETRWGEASFSDFPLSSTFGPRQLVSTNYRYDFHRGIDIATPVGTPVYAITDGVVRTAGEHSSYTDPVIILRHYRPGAGDSCSVGDGCYHSLYLHMSGWVVAEGDNVSKGDLIGYTGVSSSGFEHLHFEIRNAPDDDIYSYWSRDAIHPLTVLPYADQGADTFELSIDQVNKQAGSLRVTATVISPMAELDMLKIEAKVYDKQNGELVEVEQAGNTPNNYGYFVKPAWFDLAVWNHQYTHKDSDSIPWESFDKGGVNQCPYHRQHGESYDANVHMDAVGNDYQVGDFNGVLIAPQHYNANSPYYETSYTFKKLKSAGSLNNTCIAIEATDVRHNVAQVTHNCY